MRQLLSRSQSMLRGGGAGGSPPIVASETDGAPSSAVCNEYAVFPAPGVRNGVKATTAE